MGQKVKAFLFVWGHLSIISKKISPISGLLYVCDALGDYVLYDIPLDVIILDLLYSFR